VNKIFVFNDKHSLNQIYVDNQTFTKLQGSFVNVPKARPW